MGSFIGSLRPKRGRKALLWVGILQVICGGIFVGIFAYYTYKGYKQTTVLEATNTYITCWESSRSRIGPGTTYQHIYMVHGVRYNFETCNHHESLPAGSILWYNPQNPASFPTANISFFWMLGMSIVVVGGIFILLATVWFWPLQTLRDRYNYWLHTKQK